MRAINICGYMHVKYSFTWGVKLSAVCLTQQGETNAINIFENKDLKFLNASYWDWWNRHSYANEILHSHLSLLIYKSL